MRRMLLTGGTGEIGGAIHQRCERAGFDIVAPTRAYLDLSSPQLIASYLGTLHEPFDAFVHCGGFNNPKTIETLSDQDVMSTMQINTFSFYTITKYLMDHKLIKEGGSIVGISSIYGEISRKGRLAYSASKHALNGMIKTLSIELGAQGIMVNGVAPGFVDTKMTRQNNTPEIIEGFRQKIPLKRLAAASEIAEIVNFLCSGNTYINGQSIIADGGYSVGGFQA